MSDSWVDRDITADYTCAARDRGIFADATGGAITVTLPSENLDLGREIFVVKTDASTNAITFAAPGGYTIESSLPDTTVNKKDDQITLVFGGGTVWYGKDAAESLVKLQATTPGSQQTGNINISGTLIVPTAVTAGAGGTLVLQGANGIALGQAANKWYVDNTSIQPWVDNTADLGAATSRIRDAYIGNQIISQTANAAQAVVASISEEITLNTGGTTTDSSANLLPANSLILGVVARVTTTIVTATDWKLGDGTTGARFTAANSSLTSGVTDVGLNHLKGGVSTDATGPVQISAAKLRITTTGTPSAGKVRVTVFYAQFVPPTS